jgi:hypothetical protein
MLWEVASVRKRSVCSLAISLALFSLLLLPHAAAGQLTARLVTDPKTVGLHVTIDSVTFSGDSLASIDLILANDSSNLLTLDAARSSFIGPDGDARQLVSVIDSGFAPTLLPGTATACTLRAPVAVQTGDVVKVFLAWTRGAVSESATWVLEIADAAPPVPPTTAVHATPAQPATPSSAPAPAPAPQDTSGDSLLGGVALLLGLALVVLLGWGLWTLGSLL